MGINSERDIEANLQIGPTDRGMVRLFIEAKGVEIPMDFDPEEAEEIAEEILSAAKAARKAGKQRALFLYVISGQKLRNPAAAMALIERLKT